MHPAMCRQMAAQVGQPLQHSAQWPPPKGGQDGQRLMRYDRCNLRLGLLATLGLLGGVACSDADMQASLQANGTEVTANLITGATYTLSPSLKPGRCLMPLGGVKQNGTPVVLADCDGSEAQTWSRPSAFPNSLAVFGNYCLDIVNGQDVNGTRLQLWECSSYGDFQSWTVVGDHVQWLGHARCLDVPDGVMTDNAAIMQIWDCTPGNDNQSWEVVSVAGGQNGSGGNGGAVGTDDVNIPVGGYPTVDGSRASMAFRRATQRLMSQSGANLCASVSGFPTAGILLVQACQGASTEQFTFDGNGRISYPSTTATIGGVTIEKGSYCLSVGMAGKANAGRPVMVPCNSGDSHQSWGQAGNLLVSLPDQSCLGFNPTGQDPNGIRLGECTSRPQYGWTLVP